MTIFCWNGENIKTYARCHPKDVWGKNVTLSWIIILTNGLEGAYAEMIESDQFDNFGEKNDQWLS